LAAARHDLKRTVFAATALALVACGARAADSALTANVGTRVAHSDNVALAAPGSEQAEEIGEVTAGIVYDRTGQRQDTRIQYQAQGIYYNESKDSDEVFNTLNAQTRLALVLDRFFLDGFALYDQTVVDAKSKYSFNKLALTGNRTDVAVVGLSPNVSLDFGEKIAGELRFTDSRVNYDDPTLEDNKERVGTFTLGNSNSREGGSWALKYDSEDYDYESSPTVHLETFDVQLGYWVGPTVKLFTTQGLESDYTLVGRQDGSPGLDEHYWYLGIDWKPSERNEITVSSGERSFGDVQTFDWRYSAAHGGINVGYAEQPSTFLRDQLHSVRRSGELSPIDTLDGPNGNLFYLQKRLNVTFLLERPRSNAALRVFQEQRFDILDALNDVRSQTEEYRGGELSMGWNMNTRATIGMSFQEARRQSTLQSVNDELQYVSIQYERKVGRQGAFTANFGRESATPKGGITGENDYTENQVSVGIRRWFGSAPVSGAPRRFSGYLNAAGY
jgi:hypothetical protein